MLVSRIPRDRGRAPRPLTADAECRCTAGGWLTNSRSVCSASGRERRPRLRCSHGRPHRTPRRRRTRAYTSIQPRRERRRHAARVRHTRHRRRPGPGRGQRGTDRSNGAQHRQDPRCRRRQLGRCGQGGRVSPRHGGLRCDERGLRSLLSRGRPRAAVPPGGISIGGADQALGALVEMDCIAARHPSTRPAQRSGGAHR